MQTLPETRLNKRPGVQHQAQRILAENHLAAEEVLGFGEQGKRRRELMNPQGLGQAMFGQLLAQKLKGRVHIVHALEEVQVARMNGAPFDHGLEKNPSV